MRQPSGINKVIHVTQQSLFTCALIPIDRSLPLLAIMVYCCAVGCSNDSRFVSKGQGISFHRFPTEDSLLKEWLAKISRVGLEVTKDTRLCSVYFEPDCFERDLRAEATWVERKT